MSEPSIKPVNSHARSPLPLGHRVDGLRLVAVLGAGRFGLSYLAARDQPGEPRHLVLREYMPAGLATRRSDSYSVRPLRAGDKPDFDWGLARLRQEAEALKALEHPSLARVTRLVEENGTSYLAEEYVEGQSLATILERRGKLPEAELRYLLAPLLDGLEQVHRVGLVHGGIEPSAVIFRTEGAPVLVGFGAPRPAPPPAGDTAWSPYAPHELCDSRASVGPWTDIYALGAVLYRAITGEVPPSGPARKQAVDRGAADPLPLIASAPGYTPVLLGAVARALAPAERERPQSLSAWRTLLSRTGAGEGAAEPAAAARTRAKTNQPLLFDLDTAKEKPPAGTAEAPPVKGGLRRRRAPLPDVPPPLLGPAMTASLAAAPIVPPKKARPPVPRRPWMWGAAFAVVVVAGVLGWRNFHAPAPGGVAQKSDPRNGDAERVAAAQRVAADEARRAADARKAADAKAAEAKLTEAKAAEAKKAEESLKADAAIQERRRAEEATRRERERQEAERVEQVRAAIPAIEAALAKQDWATARTALIAAERLAPEHAKLAELRGKLVVEVAARVARADEAAARREWDDAEKLLAEAEAILPDSTTAAAGRSRVVRARNDWEASRIALALKADLLIGEALAASGKLDFAAAAEKLGEAEQAIEGFAKDHPLRAKLTEAVAAVQRDVDDVEFERHRARDYDSYLVNRVRADLLFDLAQKELHDKKNAERACVLYREAGNLGHVGAQNQLGVCFASGRGAPKDELEAYNWFRRAAEGGNAVAQFNMAHAYATGAGVVRHFPSAMAWAQKSADQGYAKAYCRLGLFRRDGEGAPADAPAAAKLFRQGADKGDEWCMALLAEAYEKGTGVGKDLKQARQWYERAAAKGYEQAKLRLKNLK